MRELSPLEVRGIEKVKAYRQPKCPGCGTTMRLDYSTSLTYPDKIQAWYHCHNKACAGGWFIKAVHQKNAAIAVEDAYKNAITRYI